MVLQAIQMQKAKLVGGTLRFNPVATAQARVEETRQKLLRSRKPPISVLHTITSSCKEKPMAKIDLLDLFNS